METTRKKGAGGWVYVLTNPSMPDLVKIGLTQKTPRERATELSKQTNMPTSFHIYYAREVGDCFAVEELLHQRFSRYRVNKKREFFKIKPEMAKREVDKLSQKYQKSKKLSFFLPFLACLGICIMILGCLTLFRGENAFVPSALEQLVVLVQSKAYFNPITVLVFLFLMVLIFSPSRGPRRLRKSRQKK